MLRQGQQTRTNESERDFISSKNDKMASVAGPIDMVKNNNIVSHLLYTISLVFVDKAFFFDVMVFFYSDIQEFIIYYTFCK